MLRVLFILLACVAMPSLAWAVGGGSVLPLYAPAKNIHDDLITFWAPLIGGFGVFGGVFSMMFFDLGRGLRRVLLVVIGLGVLANLPLLFGWAGITRL